MADGKSPAYGNRWLGGLKKHPFLVCVAILAIGFSGIGAFTDHLAKVQDVFSARSPNNPAQAIVNVAPPTVTPRPRGTFSEEFSLQERGVWVRHGVTIRVRDIGTQEQPFAILGASADGRVQFGERVLIGSELRLPSQYCDSLVVLIKSITASVPTTPSSDDSQKLPPASQDALPDKKVVGQLSGNCQE
ncbi:MAG: hypothetical protein PHS32_23000 [Rhodoferax sp.]|uniref:hypothetical protein n=1 Tax=Rhodoferax sp. TaxID=50421 RepID=UPI002613D6B0|nr:hypothetical protein [Rhodoferax sp.]MDD5336615.1 hypothetical protein [Rhodoferax sp.]